jgi:LPS-assembly lipoprotein
LLLSRKILLLLMLPLAGCGFSPLYGSNGGAAPSVAQRMDQVEVANIPERPGQILRQSLQDQMYAAGAPTVQAYVLTVNYNIGQTGIGVLADTASTYNRFTATASWTLAPVGTPNAPLVQGMATTENAANTIDQQYFALTLETDTINQQLADTIAAQIASQVAAYFKTHPAQG